MSHIYIATFTGFTGKQFSVPVHAYSIEEATAVCRDHMCLGDLLTIES